MFKNNNTSLSKFIYLLSLSILTITTSVFSQVLDVTFGNGGKVVTPINDSSTANSIAVQNDGKIIIGGNTTIGSRDYFTLVRYNIDGSVDNTFGAGGKVIGNFGGRSKIFSISLQQDGKIIAAGRSLADTITYAGEFAIVRYKNDGNIDSVFGNNGIARTEMSGPIAEIKKLLIKPDGKILAAGRVSLMTFENIPALAQFNIDGSLDSSFGINGKVENYTAKVITISDIALLGDGKIVATGETETGNLASDFSLLRYLPNGTLDGSFGTNGLILTNFNNNSNDVANSLSIQSDSAIVLAGYSYLPSLSTFALAKYRTNGTLDSSFGSGGKVTTSINDIYAIATDLLIKPTGNLTVSGNTFGTNDGDFAVAEYLFNGQLDSTFGNNGIATTDFAGFQDQAYASAIQPDGKIILAGQAGENANYSIALARYTTNVLPLKLLIFSAIKDGKTNLLQWQTAQEVNVDRFEIERSGNGREYNTVGKLKTGLSKYNFTDNKPFTGVNHYRLKMIDKDGKFEYSPVRIVNNNGSFYVTVYPLPAKDKLNIQIQSSKTEKAEISVTDISGKKLITNSISLAAGINNSVINVQLLNKGVYFLKVVTSQTTETRKIVVEQ